MPTDNPYADLESLLFKGFITDSLNFNGFDFVLKSISDSELERVKDRIPSKSLYRDQLYDCWYVAYSILQINGVFCIENREQNVVKIFNSLRKWPNKAISRIVYRCLTFPKRVSEAYRKFEAYCYEPQSRVFWKAYQGINLNSTSVTGIPGTDCNPLSFLQVQWLSFNRSEDEKISFDTNWSYVRWLGAFMNGKAAEKVDNEVMDKKRQEEDYRNEVMARAKGLSDDKTEIFNPYTGKGRDKSLEQLLYDLDVVINDKKDDHAIAMDRAKDQAIEEYREYRRQERDRRIEAINTQSAMRTSDLVTPFEIFDQKTMSDVEDFDKRKDLIISVLGIPKQVLDDIDREFEVPQELLQKFQPLINSTKSTILPVETNSGNFSGEILRGGIPKRPFQ